ncbi:hypothetical protein [Paludisphaera sp.]|uniref:hypothetical protein n=1 Tax=Paludisphaera sp. TaxID=2017432 RepID=UPI00301CEFB0
MSVSRIGWGVAALMAVAAPAGGCGGDDGPAWTPPPPSSAGGREDTGPPSAIKASATPGRRLEMPGPRSAVGDSLKGSETPRKGRGSR